MPVIGSGRATQREIELQVRIDALTDAMKTMQGGSTSTPPPPSSNNVIAPVSLIVASEGPPDATMGSTGDVFIDGATGDIYKKGS